MKKGLFKNMLLYSIGGLVLANTALHYVDYNRQKNLVKEIKQQQAIEQSIKQPAEPKLLQTPHTIAPACGLEALLDQRYDENNFLMNHPLLQQQEKMDFNKVWTSMYDTLTQGKYENKNSQGEEDFYFFHQPGKALALKDTKGEHYFLTVNHVMELDKSHKHNNKQNKLTLTEHFLKIKNKDSKANTTKENNQFTYIQLKKVIDDPELDMALFHIPKKDIPKNINFNAYPYGIGKKSELERRDKLYITGNPFFYGYVLREGIVSMKDGPKKLYGASSKDYFMTSIPLSPGDSGTPILALRDGKIELVGLAESVHNQNVCLSFAVGIDAIMERIKDAGLTDLYESMQNRMFRGY